MIILRDLTTNILPNINEHIELSNIIIFNLNVNFVKDKISFQSTIRPTYNLVFLNCNLKGVDFSNSKFYDCKFINCDLDNANFSESSLMGIKYFYSDLSGANFKDTTLNNIEFINCHFKNKNIINTDFRQSLLKKEIKI
ncbi:MAG: pentapeptide repeat-containing protein [Sulfurovum sp.]|nr:pentapeptide repeat-containing protein [Sulfurovum sp.]